MDNIDKAMVEMFGIDSLPQNDKEEMLTRTTGGEHSPDCDCSICGHEEGYEIGMG